LLRWRIRRNGVTSSLWRRINPCPGSNARRSIHYMHHLRVRCPGNDRAGERIQLHALSALHGRRGADRSWHLLVESVLPRLMDKLEHLGCTRSSVGLVLPVGYSFNADGTAIYLSMAGSSSRRLTESRCRWPSSADFCCCCSSPPRDWFRRGIGFVVLAATLSATHVLPVELGATDRHRPLHVGSTLGDEHYRKWSCYGRRLEDEREFDPVQADAAYAERFGAGVKFNLKPVPCRRQGPVSTEAIMSPSLSWTKRRSST